MRSKHSVTASDASSGVRLSNSAATSPLTSIWVRIVTGAALIQVKKPGVLRHDASQAAAIKARRRLCCTKAAGFPAGSRRTDATVKAGGRACGYSAGVGMQYVQWRTEAEVRREG